MASKGTPCLGSHRDEGNLGSTKSSILMATSRQSQGMFPTNAGNFDDAAQLSTTYSQPVGVGSAKTVQIDVVATFAADTDEVIIQVQRNGTTENLTLGWDEFKVPGAGFAFAAGRYRTSAHIRGFGITGLRVGLSSTATNVYASAGPVA